jgi:DNA-binding NarL/FixJ family response regulator
MKANRISIVHKRASVGQSLKWCFELFGTDDILNQTSVQSDDSAILGVDVLLIDADNFLRLIEANVYPSCPVILLVEQLHGDKLMEALYAGVSSVADLSKGPEEVLKKTKLMLAGQIDDSIVLIRKVIQSYASLNGQIIETDYGLTNREKEILKAMREGTHLKLIAYNTETSYDTVRTHVKHIYKKIGVMSASEAVIKAMKMKL